jgi:hypothetical protein
MQQFEDGFRAGKSSIFGTVSSKTGQNRLATVQNRAAPARNRPDGPFWLQTARRDPPLEMIEISRQTAT